jgi:hypothetical protein
MIGKGSHYPTSTKSMAWRGPNDADGGHFSISIHNTYDHPLATLPKSDSDFGIFYPIMGHMCHMPVVEVDA